MTTRLAHCASSLCSATADTAFAYLSEPSRLGEWALGCWEAVESEDGIVRGTSLFDGAETFARPVPDSRLRVVDFEVGVAPTALLRRISARVVPGGEIGERDASCLLLLTAWRTAGMDDERWHRLAAAHEAEVLVLRHRIEVTS